MLGNIKKLDYICKLLSLISLVKSCPVWQFEAVSENAVLCYPWQRYKWQFKPLHTVFASHLPSWLSYALCVSVITSKIRHPPLSLLCTLAHVISICSNRKNKDFCSSQDKGLINDGAQCLLALRPIKAAGTSDFSGAFSLCCAVKWECVWLAGCKWARSVRQWERTASSHLTLRLWWAAEHRRPDSVTLQQILWLPSHEKKRTIYVPLRSIIQSSKTAITNFVLGVWLHVSSCSCFPLLTQICVLRLSSKRIRALRSCKCAAGGRSIKVSAGRK